jgi:membrane protease YdiL (CAAX protease family)
MNTSVSKNIFAQTQRIFLKDSWISRHPMAAFIVLTYAISWTGFFFSARIDLGVINGFGVVGSAGPALAAMIVSALLRPELSGVPAGKRWRLFGVIGILTLALMAVRRLWITQEWITVAGKVTTTAAYPSLLALLMDIAAAAVVAFLLSGVCASRQGVDALLHSLDPRRQPVRWYWWAIAVGLYPLIVLLGNAISAGFGLGETAPKAAGLWYWLALDVLLTYLVMLFQGGGLEEPGWRGFALPFLQKRYSPLRSSLILAVLWTIWHWPLFLFDGLPAGPLDMAFYLLLVVAPLAVLFTAVFNRTGGSLPIAILLHVSINLSPIFLPESVLASGLWLLLILGIALWMWRAPQTFAARQVESL